MSGVIVAQQRAQKSGIGSLVSNEPQAAQSTGRKKRIACRKSSGIDREKIATVDESSDRLSAQCCLYGEWLALVKVVGF